MTHYDPIPRGYDELGSRIDEDIDFEDKEMLLISEKGISAFNEALKNPDNLITDTFTYRGIPHLDGLRTPAVYLGLRSRKIKHIDIEVPRQDENVAIKITAQDLDNPNRRFIFSEITDGNGYGDEGDFIIDDTDWLNAEKAGRPVDQLMSKFEVANWLYRQAGVSERDVTRKLKTETDPVQDAAHILSSRADTVMTQRQIKVQVRDGLWFMGEEIAVKAPGHLTQQPTMPASDSIPKAHPIRRYTLWTNATYDTEYYGGVRETVATTFSPDNPALIIPNIHSSVSLTVGTTKALGQLELNSLFADRRASIQGNVANLFESVAESLAIDNTDKVG